MTIYTQNKYVVYHITYSGNLLPSKNNSNITPSNYIGSTSLKQIESGYMGSILSKKYKNFWKHELKEHPELFNIEIASYHDTRSDAIWKELQLQKIFNVVKNPLFVNMSYATPNGFFGMDTSDLMKGKKNALGCKRSEEFKQNAKERMLGNCLPRYERTDIHKKEISVRNIGNKYGTGPRSQSFIDKLSKHYTVVSPSGEYFTVCNLSLFCKSHNLNPSGMYRVASKNQTNHKGWKCELIKNEGISPL